MGWIIHWVTRLTLEASYWMLRPLMVPRKTGFKKSGKVWMINNQKTLRHKSMMVLSAVKKCTIWTWNICKKAKMNVTRMSWSLKICQKYFFAKGTSSFPIDWPMYVVVAAYAPRPKPKIMHINWTIRIKAVLISGPSIPQMSINNAPENLSSMIRGVHLTPNTKFLQRPSTTFWAQLKELTMTSESNLQKIVKHMKITVSVTHLA